MSRHHLAVAMTLLVHLVLAGCATGRSELSAGIDAGQNPVQGMAVRIDSVQDARVFMDRPPSPDMPSLMTNDINNKSITSRAVGRKRGGMGRALGDVLLPEGTTVATLVEATVARGLRESGYRVLRLGDTGYEQAIPITVRVEQFWSWFNPGFAAVTLTNRTLVSVQGAIPPLAQSRQFSSQVQNSMQMVVESDWLAIVNKGLEALAAAVRDGIRQGPRAALN